MMRRTLNTVLAVFAVAMVAGLAWTGQAFAAETAEGNGHHAEAETAAEDGGPAAEESRKAGPDQGED